jgi:hypothetical protein
MHMTPQDIHCPKCDEHRYAQNRKKTLSIDIAHDMQTLIQAEQQFDAAIRQAREEQYGKLKLIVGRGRIRQEIRRSLDTAQWQNRIRSYKPEDNNDGAYILLLPPL